MEATNGKKGKIDNSRSEMGSTDQNFREHMQNTDKSPETIHKSSSCVMF